MKRLFCKPALILLAIIALIFLAGHLHGQAFSTNGAQPVIAPPAPTTTFGSAAYSNGAQFQPASAILSNLAASGNSPKFKAIETGSINGAAPIYYIDTNGSDAFDGQTPQTAWATLQHANSAAQSSSTILAQGGEYFSNQFPVVLTNPLTLASFGAGRAVFTSSNYLAYGILESATNNITFSNIALIGTTNFVTNHQSSYITGAGIYRSTGAKTGFVNASNFTVVDCTFQNLSFGILDIVTNGSGGAVNTTYSENTGWDMGYSAIYMVPGGGTPTRYQFTNATICCNTFSNVFGIPGEITGSPIVAIGVANLDVEWNVCHDSATSATVTGGGAGGIVIVNSRDVEDAYNMTYNMRGAQYGEDQIGNDLDWACVDAIMEHNISYGNNGAGLDLFSCNSNITVRYNLSFGNSVGYVAGRSPVEQNAELSINNDDYPQNDGITNFNIYGNIFAGNSNAPFYFNTDEDYGANFVYGNVFATAGNPIISEAVNTTFTGNDYWAYGNQTVYLYYQDVVYDGIPSWQAATGQDSTAISINPSSLPIFTGWPDTTFFSIFSQATQPFWFSQNNGIVLQSIQPGNVLIAGAGNLKMTGTNNLFQGADSGLSNTIGSFNSAFAPSTLQNNTTGSYNSAFGIGSLTSNKTGNFNAAYGVATGQNNTNGSFNTWLGVFSGIGNMLGNNNTAAGFQALLSGGSNQNNTAVGFDALYASLASTNNTAEGWQSMSQLKNGSHNIAIGYIAGSSWNANESTNIVIGNPGTAGDNRQIRIGTTGEETNLNLPGSTGLNIGGTQGTPGQYLGIDSSGHMALENPNGVAQYWTNVQRFQDPLTANLNNWTAEGTAGVFSIGASKLNVKGNAGEYKGDYLLANGVYTVADNWTWTGYFSVTNGTNVLGGIGLGMSSGWRSGLDYNTFGLFFTGGTGTIGSQSIYAGSSNNLTSLVFLSGSASGFQTTFNTNDWLKFTATKRGLKFTMSVSNITQGKQYWPQSYQYRMDTNTFLPPFLCQPSIMAYGAVESVMTNMTFTVDSWEPCQYLVIGDSETQGYGVTNINGSWLRQLQARYPHQFIMEAEVGMWASNISLILPEITNCYKVSNRVLWNLGLNDTINGGTLATTKTNIVYGITNMLSNGIPGIQMITTLPSSSANGVDTSPLWSWEVTNAIWQAYPPIDVYTPFLAYNSLYNTNFYFNVNDGFSAIHLNAPQGSDLYESIVEAAVFGETP